MKNIRLDVEYDGTAYAGWQRQPQVRTVQGELERALLDLTGEAVEVFGCSRTDAGVHALNHVSNFKTVSTIPADRFCYALNARLPKDIVVKASSEVDEEFHARFSCEGKRYLYQVYSCDTQSALLANRSWFTPMDLDVKAMNLAAQQFVGEYDFKAFQAVGSSAQTTVRQMTDACVYEREIPERGRLICFEIAGTGFLYNMVRIMTGTLLDVGKGRKSPEDMLAIIAGGERQNAGPTAPPQGLFLKEVYY